MKMYLFPLRSTADLAHAARTLRSAAERGEPAAVEFLSRHGMHTDTVSHTAMLEVLAREAGLVSYEIARKLLPEAEKTTLELAQALADQERQQVVEAQGRLRIFPESFVNDHCEELWSAEEARLLASASAHGFRCSHITSKKIELYCSEKQIVCYVDRTRLPASIAIIVAPWTSLDALRKIDGLDTPEADRWYHSSNLRCFPRHHHRGKNQIPYGYSITCRSEDSFARLLPALS